MICLATDNGIILCEQEDEWRIVQRGLEGQRVTSVVTPPDFGGVVREGVILAGTSNGIFRSGDNGQNWVEANAGLSHRHVRWLAYHPDISDLAFAGTEPAAIYLSQDGGKSWLECTEVSRL